MKKLAKQLMTLLLIGLLFANSSTAFAAPKTTSPPSAPTLSYYPMTPTNGNVSVTIYYPTGAVNKQYRIGTTGIWSTYVGPVVLSANAYVGARYQNSTGTWSTAGGVKVANIDKTAPLNPSFSSSSTSITNQNVSITIAFSTDSATKQYKVGSTGLWTNYTTPIAFSANETLYAKASDALGNWTSTVSYIVSNIDKIAPLVPVLTADTITPTNSNVNVTISFASDATVKQYKLGDLGTWTSYTSPIVVDANEAVYAKAKDIAGNWSPEGLLNVTNIDKVAPESPIVTFNSSLTNQDVTVTIDFSNDSVIQQYKTDSNGIWVDYSAPLTITTNDTVYAKARDEAGNWTAETSIGIQNIDKIAPTDPTLNVSTSEWTNQEVLVSIDYSSDSFVKQYKLDDLNEWMDYTGPISLSSNATIYAKASDEAGNLSNEMSLVIGNIDKTPPTNPLISVNTTTSTNQNVTVEILYSDDAAGKHYKIGDGGAWLEYTSPIVISTNTVVYAKAMDLAGNTSSESSYTIDIIDTIAPATPLLNVSIISPTDQPVAITINYSNDSFIQQYKIGSLGLWTDYTSALVLTKNNTVYARASDAVGNWSSEGSLEVSNITKTVLGYTVKYHSTDASSYNSMVAHKSLLNEIATATFSVDATGKLTGTAPADQVNYANNNGIRTKLMVSNNFDATIAKQLLDSSVNRTNLTNNILNIINANNYKGVDIDIENVPASCRDNFTALMQEVYTTLKPLGYDVSVAVPAKVNDSSSATWNYAFDYKSLAMYSDFLMIMAYDEHYPGGTPGAVASIGWVTNVVNYSLTVAPKEKVILGLAAYGYDWVSGATTKAYSINGCINLANQYGSTINFDTITKSKYFTYTVNDILHTVWFEDGETIAYKLDLANSTDLKGIGIWRIGLENNGFWDAIKTKLNK